MTISGRRAAAVLLITLPAAACTGADEPPSMDSGDTNPSTAGSPAEWLERPDLARHFDAFDVPGTFVLVNGADGSGIVLDPDRAREGFVPASTFKIFNSLVALETGVVDLDEVFPWDGRDRGITSWNQDQRMREAFQRSTVWYYQEVARRVGEERMREALERDGYGNRDIGGGIDQFWLSGDLRISAEEQIDFLRRMYRRELDFRPEVVDAVEELLVMERCPNYVIRGKTGWETPGGRQLGWLVGWVERDGVPHFFALNLESEDPNFPMVRARREILTAILREEGVLPAASCGEVA